MTVKLSQNELPTSTFTCGPSQGHPQIRKVQVSSMSFERSHRAGDMALNGLYKQATENLRKLFGLPQDYTIIFYHGGATTAMDAIVWNMTKDSISGLNFGAFSKLWTEKIASVLEDSVRKDFKKAAEGEYFPKEKPDFKASLVMLTPNETSTGVQIPDSYLKEAWENKGPDTLVAWDCTSCAGGRDLPKGIYDIMVFSMQKCFGVGGGSSVIILSPKAVARVAEVQKIRRIPYAIALPEAIKRAQEKAQTLNTPSTINIWMFNEAAKWMLENGGLPAMEAMCRKHAKYVLDFAAKTDYLKPLIKEEDYRSFTTLTLEVTDAKIKDADISAALKATGLPNLADGIKKYSSVKANSLRIGCFPFVDIYGTEQFEKLMHAVDLIVKDLRSAK